jgi:hypothetical protein
LHGGGGALLIFIGQQQKQPIEEAAPCIRPLSAGVSRADDFLMLTFFQNYF